MTELLASLPRWIAALPLLLLGIGVLAMLSPSSLVRALSRGRDPFDVAMLPFGAGLALLGVLVAGVHAFDGMRALQVQGWQRTPATITRSVLVEVMQPRSSTPAWRPDVSFDYSFGGQPRQGHRIAYRRLASSDRDVTLAWLLATYPEGARVTAWVDPDAPGDAVLEHDPSPWTWGIAAAGLALAGAGIHLMHIAGTGARPPTRDGSRKRAR